MGYVDAVGTLPENRRRGVASALIRRVVTDSHVLGNRWTALEAVTGGETERLYERLSFCAAYYRHRYIKNIVVPNDACTD